MAKKRCRRKRGYHRGLYESKKAGICKYRSSWELKYMQFLDADDSVLKYEYEGVVIQYVSNIKTRKIRKYYPDFFVHYYDNRNVLVEIKPSKKIDQLIVQKKTIAARQWCLENNASFEFVTEIELKQLCLL